MGVNNIEASLPKFIEHVSKMDASLVEVRPFMRIMGDVVNYRISYLSHDVKDFVTDIFGRRIYTVLKNCNETIFSKAISEEYERGFDFKGEAKYGEPLDIESKINIVKAFRQELEFYKYDEPVYILRNVLTAHQRLIQLEHLLGHKAVVYLRMPPLGGRYEHKDIDEVYAEALASGLKPYPLLSVGDLLPKKG